MLEPFIFGLKYVDDNSYWLHWNNNIPTSRSKLHYSTRSYLQLISFSIKFMLDGAQLSFTTLGTAQDTHMLKKDQMILFRLFVLLVVSKKL